MSDIFKVTINERQYTGHKMNPLEGLAFCLEVGELYRNGDGEGSLMTPKAQGVIKKALECCYTPENQSLSDEVVFNTQFQRYPADMFPLAYQAVQGLCADFFPVTVNTTEPVLEKQKKEGK
jgi:hypothetical protein